MSNDISASNKSKLEKVCSSYEAEVKIIDCMSVISSIFEGGKLNFNPLFFLRIFIPQIVPDIDKALFIDSDVYVCNGIKELYDNDIDNYYCAMSYNMPIYRDMLQEAQMNLNDGYYNAGIILLNLKAWREDEIQKKILKFYYDNGGNFPTDDQSVINAIVARKIVTLPYKYNG